MKDEGAFTGGQINVQFNFPQFNFITIANNQSSRPNTIKNRFPKQITDPTINHIMQNHSI